MRNSLEKFSRSWGSCNSKTTFLPWAWRLQPPSITRRRLAVPGDFFQARLGGTRRFVQVEFRGAAIQHGRIALQVD